MKQSKKKKNKKFLILNTHYQKDELNGEEIVLIDYIKIKKTLFGQIKKKPEQVSFIKKYMCDYTMLKKWYIFPENVRVKDIIESQLEKIVPAICERDGLDMYRTEFYEEFGEETFICEKKLKRINSNILVHSHNILMLINSFL